MLVAAASTAVLGVAAGRRGHRRRPAGTGSGSRSSTRTIARDVAARRPAPGSGSTSGCCSSARSARSRSGLVIALLRTLRGPVFFPVRALATGYTYTFRGAAADHRALPVHLRRARAAAAGHAVGAGARRGRAGRHLRRATWPRCSGPASSRCTRASSPAARSLGLTYRQTMRHVVLPQAVRRVAPPLLNDTGGAAEGRRPGLAGRADRRGPGGPDRRPRSSFNYTPYIVAGVLFVLLAIPLIAVTDWVTLRAARRQAAAAPMSAPVLSCRGRAQGLRRHGRARRPRPGRGRARGGGADRRVRLGQVDAAALRQPARDDRRRHDPPGRRAHHRPADQPGPGTPADRHRVPVVQPVPAHDRAGQHHPGAAPGAPARPGRGARRRRVDCSTGSGLADKADGLPGPALRRPAAAGGDRPGAGQLAPAAAARRGHLGARPGTGRRGADDDPRPEGATA